MAKTILYRGESKYRTFILKAADGTAIPHASIDDIIVTLKVDERICKQYRKVTTEGFDALIQESAAGTYSFPLTEADTLDMPASPAGVIMEVWRNYPDGNLDDGLRRIAQSRIYDEVLDSNYAEL